MFCHEVKCKLCKKKDLDVNLYSIGEKWAIGKNYYGRIIYSCEKCYEKNLKTFMKKFADNGQLIIKKPLEG